MKNYTITVNGNVYEVTVEESNGRAVQMPVAALPVAQKVAPAAPVAAAPTPAPTAPVATPAAPAATGTAGAVKVVAPMPGKILGVKVSAGQNVKKGDVVVILEAMKMENEIVAPQDGTIASINVSTGQSVESGEVIATLN